MYGICSNFLSSDRYSLHEEKFNLISKYFDFIEFPAFRIVNMDDFQFESFSRKIKDSGIKSVVFTNMFPSEIKLFGREKENEQIRVYLRSLMERASCLDVKKIVLGSGPSRNIPSCMDKTEAVEVFLELLISDIVPMGEMYDIDILLEPLTPEKCNFINSIGEAAYYCERVNCSKLSIVADSYNLYGCKNLYEEIQRYHALIKHVHLSDKERKLPSIDDSIIWNFVKSIKEAKITIDCSLECEIEDDKYAEASKQIKSML